MNIIQMKQEIKDIRAELAAEIDKGMEMAKNRATTLESIKAQSDKVDDLQIREALLQKQSRREYLETQAQLARALTRLRVKHHSENLD